MKKSSIKPTVYCFVAKCISPVIPPEDEQHYQPILMIGDKRLMLHTVLTCEKARNFCSWFSTVNTVPYDKDLRVMISEFTKNAKVVTTVKLFRDLIGG